MRPTWIHVIIPDEPALARRQEFPLLEHLKLNHPLFLLAKLIDWNAID
jgi:hypothetical protein